MARILLYVRDGERCPAGDFLDGLTSQMTKKFAGPFIALMKTGSDYCNQQRFWPLHGAGKPLWEFKEHDHRLYCHRYVVQGSKSVQVFLLCGWVKDKRGRTKKEDREIEKAKALYEEFLLGYPGGHI